MNHIHFIGIGGVGMSGLAQVLLSRGVTVTGSDPSINEATERLIAQGAVISAEQNAENIERNRPDYVIVTAAIPPCNVELVAAREAGIPIESRADFLGRLMSEFNGPRIAVAGTHGKTTTTAMVAEVLVTSGIDPTVLIGGEYPPIGGNVRLGRGDAFLTEACEAYDSFLSLRPDMAIITNIEADHLDHYGDEASVLAGFQHFVTGIVPHGTLICCGDDPGCRNLTPGPGTIRQMNYGLDSDELDVLGSDVRLSASGSRFAVREHGIDLGEVHLKVPGRHNILNALGAVGVGLACGIPFDIISEGLSHFSGTGRRFETVGERDGVLVVDDYAHHPTEIRATLSGARQAFPDRRLIAVFQPHLYSRTRDFMTGFGEALSDADAVLLTDIYPAREQPIPGVRVSDLTRLVAERAPNITLLYLPKKEDLVGALEWVAHSGDVVLTMGAGDIRSVGEAYLSMSRAAPELERSGFQSQPKSNT